MTFVPPQLVWLCWLGVPPHTETSPVGFLVRARAWVAGLVPGRDVYEGQPIDVSLPLFLPPTPSLYK